MYSRRKTGNWRRELWRLMGVIWCFRVRLCAMTHGCRNCWSATQLICWFFDVWFESSYQSSQQLNSLWFSAMTFGVSLGLHWLESDLWTLSQSPCYWNKVMRLSRWNVMIRIAYYSFNFINLKALEIFRKLQVTATEASTISQADWITKIGLMSE